MEWIESLKKSVDYMEQHLLEDITAENVAKSVNISNFYFQKGFKLITGMSVGEYIRNRRLYLAALELIIGEEKIIDISYKYGYETPESFSKAFRRFHGISPAQVKGQWQKIQTFQPLVIKISLQGGNKMDCRIEKMEAFKVMGKEGTFRYDNAFGEIPKFWNEFCQNDMERCCQEIGEDCNIGMYGVNIDTEMDGEDFRYLIAGDYKEGHVPQDLMVEEIPAFSWAKFRSVGPLPGALQAVNKRVFEEWLPGNGQYEIAAGYNIELYTKGDMSSLDYVCEMWIPVKEK